MELVNVVGCGRLPIEVNLEKIAFEAEDIDVEYDPAVHHGAYIRLGEGNNLVSFYKSGKYIIRAKSLDSLEESNQEFLEYMRENLDLGVIEPGFNIQNMVFVDEIDFKQSIDELALKFPEAEYNPEEFAGLVHRMENSTILIFESGKIVVSGASTREEASSSINDLIQQIEAVS